MDITAFNISYALEFAMAAPGLLMVLAPVYKHLRRGRSETYAMAISYLALLVGSGAVICRRFYLPTNAVLVPGVLLLFISYARSVDLSLAKKFFCYANATMMCAFATMYATVLAAPWEASNSAKVLLPQSGALALVVAVVLCLLFWRTLTVKLPTLLGHSEIDDLWRWLVFIPLLLTVLMWWSVPQDLSLVLHGRTRVAILVLAAFIPAVEWLLYHIAWNVMSRVWDEAQLRQEVTLLRAEERRYTEFRTYMSEARGLRHDFRHHLLAMRGMLEANKLTELSAYLDQLSSIEAEGQRPQLCKNMAVDAVAAYYDALAQENRVNMTWFLDLPEELPVAEIDFCSILGNLVENAIIASAELEESKRWVEVVSQEVTDHALGINVRNSFAGEVAFGRDGLPKTRKRGHGIGLRSVVTTVQRYNGGFDARAKDGEFFAGAILYHE